MSVPDVVRIGHCWAGAGGLRSGTSIRCSVCARPAGLCSRVQGQWAAARGAGFAGKGAARTAHLSRNSSQRRPGQQRPAGSRCSGSSGRLACCGWHAVRCSQRAAGACCGAHRLRCGFSWLLQRVDWLHTGACSAAVLEVGVHQCQPISSRDLQLDTAAGALSQPVSSPAAPVNAGTQRKLAGQEGWLQLYQRAVDTCPTYAPAHYNLGEFSGWHARPGIQTASCVFAPFRARYNAHAAAAAAAAAAALTAAAAVPPHDLCLQAWRLARRGRQQRPLSIMPQR